MAQLKDTLIQGSARVTDALYATTLHGALALSEITGATNLQAIEALTDTNGLLKKTTSGWILDTAAYSTLTLGSTAGAALAASGSAGTATTAARSDHVHPLPTAADIGAAASGHTHNYASSSTAGGAATNITTNVDTTNELYVTGVNNNATTVLKYDNAIKIKNDILIANGIGSSLGQFTYPNTGVYMTETGKVGALQIKIPSPGSSAGIISFNVNIITYITSGSNTGETMVTYHCGGFLTTTNNTWNQPTATYCYSTGVGPLADLPVAFRNDGTDRYILIGTTSTTWYLPQVSITNISVGKYASTAQRTAWLTDWDIDFVTTLPGTTDDNLITHPNTFNATFPINQITSTNTNRIIISNANGVLTELAAGTSGQVLTSNGSDTPTWETPTSSPAGIEILRL